MTQTSGRLFAYCRVSTTEQTTENQIVAMHSAGYKVNRNRIITETISGSCQTMQRPEFSNLISHKMEPGDTLLVLKMDRLGRDMIDIMSTLKLLDEKGLHIISLDLGNVDLASTAGKFQMQVMAAVAEFERNRIRERTQEGLARAKAEGKKLGRPKATDTTEKVQRCKLQELSQKQTAEQLKIGIATVKRHWNKSTT